MKFKAGAGRDQIEAVAGRFSLETVKEISPGLFLMKITNGADPLELQKILNDLDPVSYSEPNYIMTTM